MPRIVLGLDPGTKNFGWGVVELDGLRARRIASGVLKLKARLTTPQKLVAIRNMVLAVVVKHRPAVVSLETTFLKYFNVVARLGEARGVALCVAEDQGLEVLQWPTALMRKRIGLKGNAKKEEIASLVKLSLGLSGPLEFDETDALALAMACKETD